MAESSTLSFYASFRLLPGLSRPSDLLFPTKLSVAFSSPPSLCARSLARCRAGNSGDGSCFGGDLYGPYPWESFSSSDERNFQWVTEDKITLFTSEGLVHIGGSLVPRHFPTSDKEQVRSKISQRSQQFQESDYMDPSQVLCLGALFDIAATNGQDMGRRLCIFGFCRSIEMLSDVVEYNVLEHGGEVVAAEKESKGGLQEKLTMTVAVPLLWGVPPASETLHFAVRSGGGIVEKIYWQWDFL
ncbi:hypothetical protein KSP40_PGU001677 [Platanthera guangdongensis]|uniref:DUF7811 domain-containing protein n=1 Tax=Platanthera guangdongensis TaxID=2320717 RepID=A0ABR2M1U4_9ASPA